MSVTDVPDTKLKRAEEFVSCLGGGELADALMSLIVGYQQRGVRIEHLKERHARLMEEKA